MSELRRWRDSGHLDRAIDTAGGPDALDAVVSQMLDEARGWRLADMRKRLGLTQAEVAARMEVRQERVSVIKRAN